MTTSMWASDEQFTMRSSSRYSSRASKPSSATMLAPTSPSEAANRPRVPGMLSSRTRIVTEKAAVGETIARRR